jgi:hypothetical protein
MREVAQAAVNRAHSFVAIPRRTPFRCCDHLSPLSAKAAGAGTVISYSGTLVGHGPSRGVEALHDAPHV